MSGQTFARFCLENFLQSAPGASILADYRTSAGRQFYEYWPTLLPQSVVNQKACLEWTGEKIDIAAPKETKTYIRQQESYETANPVDLSTKKAFGPTTRAPLGHVVLARSGDKASDANVGFFVRQDDEYEWLKSLLTVEKIKQLLGPKEYLGHGIDRFEMHGLKAVHFLIHDHLDGGFNSCSTLDTLGKNVGEYLRAKYVDIPDVFLARGRV